MSDVDAVLNLGMMLVNGKVQVPDAVRLILTDSSGFVRELHVRTPNVAGRVDDYAVPLRSGSAYTLTLKLTDYWCPNSKEFWLKLPPGRYSVRAEFTGHKAQHSNSDPPRIALMPFWTGKLKSDVAQFQIGIPVFTKGARREEPKRYAQTAEVTLSQAVRQLEAGVREHDSTEAARKAKTALEALDLTVWCDGKVYPTGTFLMGGIPILR